MVESLPRFTNRQVEEPRPPRNRLDARRPYAWLSEPECNARGEIVQVATLFLANRECPLRCLMCDLWKNTLTESVRPGDIPEQIRWGLEQLPRTREIKLYNSGNFCDPQAIPPQDYPAIAALVRGYDTVIVENHPKFCDDKCRRFRDLIAPAQLEVALGLETCHAELLRTLNKAMTLEDFDRAAGRLHRDGIRTRAFVLLKPPFLDEAEAIEWTLRSLDYAFDRGVNCCAVIPTRAGNGIMDQLQRDGRFAPPRGESLEQVLRQGLAMRRGRVFVDLWDADRFFTCPACRAERIERLQRMNLRQVELEPVLCRECVP